MTIYTTYVYGPLSNAGSVSGRQFYCVRPTDTCVGSDAEHVPCGSGWIREYAVDIAASGDIYLRATNVKSIRTYIETTCCGCGCSTNFCRLIKVELYGKVNGGCYMGSVGFGHVMNPQVAHGALYNYTNPFKLGTANTDNGGCGAGCCSGCSSGIHSHMQVMGGSIVAPCCNATVTSGTQIYRFTWNDINCPY